LILLNPLFETNLNHIHNKRSTAVSGPGSPHYRGFTITLRHTIHDRAPLVERAARRRDLYLTTYNTRKRI